MPIARKVFPSLLYRQYILVSCLVFISFPSPFLARLEPLEGKKRSLHSTDERKSLLYERMTGRGGAWLGQMLSGFRRTKDSLRATEPIAQQPFLSSCCEFSPRPLSLDFVDLQQSHPGGERGAEAQRGRSSRVLVSSQPEKGA